MVHHFVAIQSNPHESEQIETMLLAKMYPTTPPNQLGVSVQPNVRRAHLYRITIPKENVRDFLNDLSPYNTLGTKDSLKNKMQLLFGFIDFCFRSKRKFRY